MATLYADQNQGDRVIGTEENDVIIGGNGNDSLSGGREISGSDYIEGGNGNDFLVGDNSPGSSDVLVGESGSDTFVIADGSRLGNFNRISSDNAIKIKDYSSEDTIVFNVNNFSGLYDVHYGAENSEDAITFIYDENREILAAISGTEHFYIN